MRAITQVARVLEVLKEGPSTAGEVAEETGLSLKHASAYLCDLVNRGIAKKNGLLPRERCPECGHKRSGASPNIYALIDQVASP